MKGYLAVICFAAVQANAAMSPNAVWEVRTTGSDSNGGCFVAGVSAKDVTTSATLVMDSSSNVKVTSSVHNFVSTDVNKYVNVTAGTNWIAGWYQILSVSANAAILDHSPSAAGNANAGTYNLYSGIDYSQQNAAQLIINNSTVVATTTGASSNILTFTSGYTPTANDVGNCFQAKTGTNINPGTYEITAFTSTTWTVTGAQNLTTATGAGSAVTGNMGGAFASLGQAVGVYVGNNKIFVKNTGIYSMTAGVTFATASGASNASPMGLIAGYTSTRSDGGMPTIQLSTNTGMTAITLSANGNLFRSFSIDCNSLGNSTGILLSATSMIQNVKIQNCTTRGITITTALGTVSDCELTGMTSTATAVISIGNQGVMSRCWIHDNAATGVLCSGSCNIDHNLITNNTGTASDGVQVAANANLLLYNTIYGSGRDGIRQTSQYENGDQWRGNILANNGVSATGYNMNCYTSAGKMARFLLDGNAYYQGSAAGNRNNCDDTTALIVDGVYTYVNSLDRIATVMPFTNAGGNDFTLNSNANGGVVFRGSCTPGTMPGASLVGYIDCGALQHQAAQYGAIQ